MATNDSVPHCKKPCAECPWKKSSDPGKFPAERYEALRSTSGAPGHEAPVGSPMFACHMTPEGREKACAGWLATEGPNHLGVRLAVITGRLPGGALRPKEDWPELFDSFDDMAETQAAD